MISYESESSLNGPEVVCVCLCVSVRVCVCNKLWQGLKQGLVAQ